MVCEIWYVPEYLLMKVARAMYVNLPPFSLYHELPWQLFWISLLRQRHLLFRADKRE